MRLQKCGKEGKIPAIKQFKTPKRLVNFSKVHILSKRLPKSRLANISFR